MKSSRRALSGDKRPALRVTESWRSQIVRDEIEKQKKVDEIKKILPYCPDGTVLCYYCPVCSKVDLVQGGRFEGSVYRCLSCKFEFYTK